MVFGEAHDLSAQTWFDFELEPGAKWRAYTDSEITQLKTSPQGAMLEKLEAKGVWDHAENDTTIIVTYRDHFPDKPLRKGFQSLLRAGRKFADENALPETITDLDRWPPHNGGDGLWVDEKRLRGFWRWNAPTGVRIEQGFLMTRTGFVALMTWGDAARWPTQDVRSFYDAFVFRPADLDFDPDDVEVEASYEQTGRNVFKLLKWLALSVVGVILFSRWWANRRTFTLPEDDEAESGVGDEARHGRRDR